MSALISYGIGYTANSAAATSLVIQPPPVYAAGNLLVMGVIAGGTSGGVAPAVPSGWTRRSASGAILALFTKTATASESAYTVTLASTSCASGFVAAYPAATIAASSFGNSGTNVTTWTGTFPGGVTGSETVLLVGGAVNNGTNAGYQNFNFPSATWTTDVPVFGPALPANPASVQPVAIGLAEVTGSTGNPALTSTEGCSLYGGFAVLNITGTAPSPYQVTATSQAPEAITGMALTVKALTGAASVAAIVSGGATESFYASGVSGAPSAAITPNATGSVVYGALAENFNVTGSTFTALGTTTFSQNVADTLNTAIYGTLKSSSTTTASTPVTLGGSAPVNAYTVAALAEILASGSIAEAATATVNAIYPGQYATTTAAQTAVFASPPPAGSLLVAMVSADSAYANGNASVVITDTGGLTWTKLVSSAYPAYAGVFVAQVPVSTGWNVIQSAKTAATATGATSASATFGTALSSGTKVIAAVSVSVGSAATVTGVSDGSGNALALIGRKTLSSVLDVSLWAMDTPAGDVGAKPAITATLGASSGQISLVVQEVSGLLPGTTPADGTLGSNSGAGGSSTGSASYSSTASNEYLVAVYGDDGGPETWTKPSALTADPNSVNANSYADCAIAYGNSTDGTEAGSWALAGTSADWATLLVAFQLAGGATTITAADTWTGTDTATVAIGGHGYDAWSGTEAAAVTAQSTASPVFAASYSPAGATSLAVTAAQSGTGTSDGIALTVKVVTGASGSPIGATAESAAVTTPELAITPSGTGSWVYGALADASSAAAFTAAANTTFTQNQYWAGDATTFATFRGTGTTTASTPVTLGATAPAGTAGQLAIALLEIKTSGTLAEDASSPAAAYTTTATTLSTASFAPPPGSLLVAMVSSDDTGTANQSMTMGISDSSGLTWTRQVTASFTSGTGTSQVATVWTATAPSSSGGDWTTAATPKTQAVTAAPGNVIVILGGSQSSATTLGQPSGGPASWTAGQSSTVTGNCAAYAWSSAVPGLSQGGGSGSGGAGTGTTVPMSVTTAFLPTAQVGQVYSVTLAAAGGTGAGYTWTVSGGSLPAGLTLTSSTGVISGTPSGSASTASITVKVTDSGSNSATGTLVMTVITGPVTGPSGTWVLAFADEFNVPYPTPYGTGPDPNTWADHYINGDMFRSNDGSNEVEWYPHGYYGHSVADSVLTLTTQWQNPKTIDPACPSPLLPDVTNTGEATSGMASSHLSFALTYGYVEVREQHPTTPVGSATASWMETRDGVWPPEIDIDEWNAQAGDVHNGYLNVANTWQNNYYAEDSNYHVYGMHLASGTVTFYVDGAQTYQATYDGNPFPWFVILNAAAGSNSTSAGYPFNYNIDYVRAWVPSGVPAAPVITSISPSDGIASGGDISVSFGTVSGATSYRVTASATDAMADGWGGNVGEPTERLTATGTSSPITVTGMPSGVRFNFTVAAINATGYSAESAPAGPQLIEIQLTTAVLPNATIGTAYSATLTAQAGVTPYTWTVSSGSLPAGLSLNSSTGVISGTPTGSGTSDFTVKVTGASGWSGAGTAANGATAALSITTSGGTGGGGGSGTTTLTITTTSLPGATTSTTYSTGLTATGGTGTGYTWTVSSGALPSWATLGSSAGDITGDPTAAGTASFTVKVTDSGGNTATQALSITTSAASSTNPSWDPSGSWTIAFDDEFTGTSLNTTYWGAGWQAKSGNSGPINSSEATSYTSNNVSVSGGYLNLALTGTSGASGACVTTNTNGTGGSQGFAAGAPVAFEARMNLPGATSGSDTGIYNWPAFWNDGQVWPTDGEIDVLEGLGGFAAYHIHDSAGGPGANVGSLGNYVGWHTFGCYWQSSGVIDFYYDGVLVGSETGNFTQPHYIIVNYTTTPGAGDPTGVMQVDWVRAWTPG